MDRRTLEEQLAQAERHILQSYARIERQREIVAELKSNGRDADLAADLLDTYLDLESVHIAHRDRLLATLQR
jgi:hypothetical protein